MASQSYQTSAQQLPFGSGDNRGIRGYSANNLANTVDAVNSGSSSSSSSSSSGSGSSKDKGGGINGGLSCDGVPTAVPIQVPVRTVRLQPSATKNVNSKHKVSSMALFEDKIAAAKSITDCCAIENSTPEIARLAALDYKLNGARARGDFVGPRWVPDPESEACTTCSKPFDWVSRKHHCRHCGHIFCEACSNYRCLLPRDFGIRDPQRVCLKCYNILQPHQRFLTGDIANHLRTNKIEIASDNLGNCTFRQYLNLPFSKTLGSEIRKASYSITNIMNLRCVKDGSLTSGLIARASGLAFITAAKGGVMCGGQFGTGLVVSRLPDGRWSGPIAIGMIGVCWGPFWGAEVTDYIIILNSSDAVNAFAGTGLVSVGASVDVALCGLGR
jgi:hypothetical protein